MYGWITQTEQYYNKIGSRSIIVKRDVCMWFRGTLTVNVTNYFLMNALIEQHGTIDVIQGTFRPQNGGVSNAGSTWKHAAGKAIWHPVMWFIRKAPAAKKEKGHSGLPRLNSTTLYTATWFSFLISLVLSVL